MSVQNAAAGTETEESADSAFASVLTYSDADSIQDTTEEASYAEDEIIIVYEDEALDLDDTLELSSAFVEKMSVSIEVLDEDDSAETDETDAEDETSAADEPATADETAAAAEPVTADETAASEPATADETAAAAEPATADETAAAAEPATADETADEEDTEETAAEPATADETADTADTAEAADTSDTTDTIDTTDTDAAGSLTMSDIGITGQTELAASSSTQGAVVLAELDTDTVSVEDLLGELDEDPNIAYVQPNYTYSLLETTTNDPYASSSASTYQYYLYSSGFTDAWDYSKTNKAVTVAVIDTGCNLKHADLKSTVNSTYAYDATTGKLLSKSGVKNNGDSYGHGTMVCGIISGYANNGVGIAGASYNASVLPIRVFDNNNSADTGDIITAYAYLESLITSGKVTNLKVINMSIGYYSSGTESYDYAVRDAIATMLDEYDVLTVCAGGNGDSSGNALTSYIYPADFDECVSVTSVTKSGANSTFSDYNDAKDISAYGETILSTYMTGGYAAGSGTSFAAPQVAAAAALMFAADSSLTASEVVEILEDTATEVTGNVHSSSGSAGILDAEAAVKAALGITSSNSSSSGSSSSGSSSSSSGSSTSSSSGSTGSSSSGSSSSSSGSNSSGSSSSSSGSSSSGSSSSSSGSNSSGSSSSSSGSSSSSSGSSSSSSGSSSSGSSSSGSSSSSSGSSSSGSSSSSSGSSTSSSSGSTGSSSTSSSSSSSSSSSGSSSSVTAPGKVTISSASLSSSLTKVTLKWKKVSGASGYVIYRSVSGGSYKKVKTITSGSTLSWSDSGLSLGKTYRYKIRAYKTSGSKTVYGSYSSVKKLTTKPSAVTLSSVKTTSAGNVKITWKKLSSASGYQIYRSTNGGSYKKVKTITSGSTVSWTDKTVTAGRVYRYKVRAYKKSGSTTVTGSYSSVKKVTAKPAKAAISSVSSKKSKKVTVKWKNVSGAAGYQIAYRVKGTSEWKYVTTTSKSKVLSKLKSKKTYQVKVRAYTKYNGKKYYGSYSSVKTVKVK